MRWIIDTDPGVDDAAAIITGVKLNHDIIGISTVHGNVSLKQAVVNALRIRDLLKVDIPIYKGIASPLLQNRIDATEVHGKDGLGDTTWPDSKSKIDSIHAVDMLIEASRKYQGDLSILAIGPLTNIALAIARDRDIVNRINELVIMGGTSKAQGNTTMVGEFNFLADPEAAAIVFNSGINITLVPWETTADCFIPLSSLTKLNMDNQLAAKFLEMAEPVVSIIEDLTGKRGVILPDLVAAAAAFDKSLITEARKVYAAIETGGKYSRGLVAIDYWSTTRDKPNVNLCLEINADSVADMFIKAINS